MNRSFKTSGLFVICLAALASAANAGEIHFVSGSTITYSPATPMSGENTSSANWSGGKTVGLNLQFSPPKPYPNGAGGSTITYVDYQFVVEWIPDPNLPSDPPPTPGGLTGYFNCVSTGFAQLRGLFALPPTGTNIFAAGDYFQDTSANWANQLFTGGPSFDLGVHTTNDMPFGSFIFSATPDANGHYYANISFTMSLTLHANSVMVFPDKGSLDGYMSQTMTLHKIGSYVVQ